MNEKISGLLASCTYEIMGVKQVDQKQFAELVVRETIHEMIGQMWLHGIDQSNNPEFYKATEETRKKMGLG